MWWMTVLGLGFITAAWWMTVRAVMLSPTRQRTRRSQVQPWPDARPRRVVAMDALGRWAVSKAKGWAPEFTTDDETLARAVADELDKIEPMPKRLPERVLLSDGRRVHAVTACRHGEHDWTRIRISSMGGDVAKACTRCSKFVDLSETGIDDLDIEMEWIGRPPKSERRRARWVGERGAEPVIYPVPDLERRNLDIRGDID